MKNILRTQITVEEWGAKSIVGRDEQGTTQQIIIPDAPCYNDLHKLLYEGCKINILSSTADEQGLLHPHDIIFEPDYLLDISALARCVQPYGSPAIGYILNLFENSDESAARLLGEAANMFMDDCANENIDTPAEYARSMQKFFREYPLQLSACEDIDRNFFAQTREQFHNIQMKIGALSFDSQQRENIQLEPSFFCEPLGLQGRIDLLQGNSRLVELKSGKADEFRGGAKEEHRLQMSLYKEMLCYCLKIPRNSIKTILFYSRYPRFYRDESSPAAISEALMLRNRVVGLLRRMGYDGLRCILENITPDDLNERGTKSRLWNNYQRPRIEKILLPIKEADTLLREYFFGNVAFVAREMLQAKVGEATNDSGRSFANVWRMPTEEKRQNGNILTDLKLERLEASEGITDIILSLPEYSEDFFPNFRAGDTVFIYRRDSEHDNATNRQVTRGTLTQITPDSVTVHLRHKQRNKNLYPAECRYALEHDHLDSTFRATFRDLYSLLTAPTRRIDLLLTRRLPAFDRSRTLRGDYGSSYINDIVLKAKQADDLFMLVGPPGTGKTSQALSSMVREFYAEEEHNILLASYTNRAVDEICHTLDNLPEKPDYIRIGSEQSSLPQYRSRLLKNQIAECNNREQIRARMHGTRIIVGTIASLTARKELFRLKKFRTAIIDEATQILESQLSGLLAAKNADGESAIERFILIGDPKQLPAVVAQPTENTVVKSDLLCKIGITDYATSFFERMYRTYSNRNIDGLTATLSRQGRMHPIVGGFANRYFYANILQSIPLPHQVEALPFASCDTQNIYQKTIATRRTAFIETAPPAVGENPKINRHEAKAIALFVKAYYELHAANKKACNPSEDIGIIVPFRNQIAMVSKEIARLQIPDSENIVIDTVERFQGSQREVILFGTTISHPAQLEILSSPVTDATGTLVDRKLNVALTRARRQMFVFGNSDVLSASPLYRALINEL